MSLLLSVVSGSNLPLEGKSRTIQRLVVTAALTFAVALSGTTRDIERVRAASLATKTTIQGKVRQVERLRGSISARTALNGRISAVERLTSSVIAGKLSLQGTLRDLVRTVSATVSVVVLNQQQDKGSRRTKPALPPEYRWPKPTPEQPEPLYDVVVQAKIPNVPLPRNPAIAIALRKAAEKAERPIIQKAEKVVEKAIIHDDDEDDDLFFLT